VIVRSPDPARLGATGTHPVHHVDRLLPVQGVLLLDDSIIRSAEQRRFKARTRAGLAWADTASASAASAE